MKRKVIPLPSFSPTIARARPKRAMIIPLTVSPLDATEIKPRAITPRAKYSGAPMASAIFVMGPIRKARKHQVPAPPIKELRVAIPRALPAFPC